MNSCLTTEHLAAAICERPDCLVKKPGFKARQVTDLLLRHSRKAVGNGIDPELGQILARPQCTSCALRVMRGGKACLTESEWSHLNEMGRWHQRRQRRSRRWGSRFR